MKMNANIQLFTAAILAIIGMVLLFCGLYIDPQGEIHETVLVAYGEVLTFSGSLMGIDYRYKRKTTETNDQSNIDPTKEDRQSR
ncbi:MAG: hypothetical protein MR794_07555 [Bacteroidales bacterium]|nr:hypothetical protein [Bacteroidales bacterium]